MFVSIVLVLFVCVCARACSCVCVLVCACVCDVCVCAAHLRHSSTIPRRHMPRNMPSTQPIKMAATRPATQRSLSRLILL